MRTLLMTGVLVAILLAVPAWPQAAKPVDDLKTLVGHWRGYAFNPTTGERTSTPVNIYVKDDGTYEAHGTGVGSFRVTGALRLSDGKMTFQSTRTSGTVTLHEVKNLETMKFWYGNGNLAGEYDRVK